MFPFLKRGGHRFEDAESVELAFPQMIAALRNKAIDAAMMTEPSITNAIDAGVAVKVADYNEFYPNQQTSVLIYSEKFMKQRRAVAQKFMRAYVRGIRFYFAALKDGKIAGENAEKVIDIVEGQIDRLAERESDRVQLAGRIGNLVKSHLPADIKELLEQFDDAINRAARAKTQGGLAAPEIFDDHKMLNYLAALER